MQIPELSQNKQYTKTEWSPTKKEADCAIFVKVFRTKIDPLLVKKKDLSKTPVEIMPSQEERWLRNLEK